jgi:putative PEP-CTERM system TPR-repeat lipoprotein
MTDHPVDRAASPSREKNTLVLGALCVAVALLTAPVSGWAASFLDRAQEYFDAGDLKSASLELKNALQREPNNALARFLLGRVYLKAGNFVSAEKELKRAGELGYRGYDYDFAVNTLRLQQRRYQEVLDQLSSEIEIDSEIKKDLFAARAAALLGLGQFDEASAIFDLILTDGPHIYSLIGKARIAMSLGDPDTAREYLDRAMEMDPDDAALIGLDAEYLFLQRNFEAAKSRFAEAITLNPGRLRYQVGKIHSHLALNELEDADRIVSQLVEAKPNNNVIALQEAIVKFSLADFLRAKSAADQVLSSVEDHSQSLLIAGLSAYQLGEFQQARRRLETYLIKNPTHVQARTALGAALLNLGYADEAYELVGSSDIEMPENTAFLAVLTGAAFGAGDPRAGVRYLEKLAKKSPDSFEIHERLGSTRMALGDFNGAMEAFARAKEIDPHQREIYNKLFLAHLQQNDFEKALEVGNEAIELFPDAAIGYTLTGIATMSAGDHELARKAFEKALDQEPGAIEATTNLVNLLRLSGQRDEAERILEIAVEEHPGHLRTLLTYAAIKDSEGDYAHAEKLLRQAVDYNPLAMRPYILLARHLLRRNRPAEALTVSGEALANNPSNFGLLSVVGTAQLLMGDTTGALATFEDQASFYPNNPSVQQSLMVVREQNDDLEGALAAADRAIALGSDTVTVRLGRALYLALLGRGDESKQDLRDLKADFPDNVEIMYVEGRVALFEKRTADALAITKRAFALQPSTKTLAEMVRALVAHGETDKAITAMDNWLSDHPQDMLIHNTVAEVLIMSGRYRDAIERYRAILAIAPDSSRTLNNLAWLYTELGESREAVPLARKALFLNASDPAVADTLAIALLASGQSAEALAILESARLAPSANPSIHFHYTQALLENGKKTQAIEELETLLDSPGEFPERQEAEQLLRDIQG